MVLFHAGVGFNGPELPLLARSLRRCLSFGHHAVAVFIVLSGYCLMLPVARREGRLVGGFGRYIARRAWRILPPYYAALLGTLLLLWLVPALNARSGTIWDDTFPAFERGPIATHLLLIHNLFPSFIYRINGPLWSVATEWQIYFFFPLFLLPIWRRAGLVATVLAGFVLGCAPIWLVPNVAAHWIPWYLGLFSLGMVAAGIGFSTRGLERRLAQQVPWKAVLLGFLAVCLLGGTLLAKLWFRFMPLSDAWVGATTAALLVHLTSRATNGPLARRPMLLRCLESKPLVRLGHFSYSLYLTHLPVVALCYFALQPARLSESARMLAMIGLGVPSSLVVAYGFFWVFERRFVGQPPLFAKE